MIATNDHGDVSIQDLDGANGTFVEGCLLKPGTSYVLPVGSLVIMGQTLAVTVPSPERAPGRPLSRACFEEVLESKQPGASHGILVRAFRDLDDQVVLDGLLGCLPLTGVAGRIDATTLVIALPTFSMQAAEHWARSVDAYLGRVGDAGSEPIRPWSAVDTSVSSAGAGSSEAPVKKAARRRRVPPVSAAMAHVFELLHRVAPSMTSVLILGETGAGKEVVARTLHTRSLRPQGPFVALNCAALPEQLLEGELFGYERGAFTGAVNAKAGLVESAAEGTLFLDELGEMPLATQSKLLRVLEDRAVLRLGALRTRPVSFRLVAATNRDVREEVRAKRFRADLYYRLNGLTLRIPPLRDRLEELDALVELFTVGAAERLGRRAPNLSDEVLLALRRYPWPGNVRELRSVIERLVLLADDHVDVQHLPEEVLDDAALSAARLAETPPATERELPSPRNSSVFPQPGERPHGGVPASGLEAELAELERGRILAALEAHAGNQTRAAESLGVTRRVLLGRLERYGIARPRRRP